MSLPSPVDQAVRDRIARALDDTLFVEAGAGTGKTTALVSRIVALVRSGLTTIDRIAAITFTEAAASELREKVRLDLEKEAKCPSLEQGARERCSRAVGNLESAFIQTLHSFAGALLSERPLDAGLPPTFDIVAEIEADISFEDRWRLWLDEALDSPDLAPHFLRCLSLGLRLEDLRKTAKAFHKNYDLLDEPFPLQQEPESRAAEAVAGAAPELRRLLPLARSGVEDPLASHAARVAALGDRLATLGLGAGGPVATLSRWGKLSSTSSKQAAWDTDPATGANGCKAIKDRLKELEELRSSELQAVRRAAILPLLEGLRRFTLGYAAERKDLGRAEFHDLLVWARNLVRDNLEARAYFQHRFSHILIDEFQDTDPIQAEIAFFLSRSPDDAGAPDEAAKDWTKVKVAPGKLFVVGDPKQSIYRFRRADIAAVEKVRNLLGTGSVALVQNFRSQDTVIAWCNAIFGQWMEDDGSGVQAKYIPLSASWTPPESCPPLGVHWLGGPYKGPAGLVRQIESGAIASLLLQIKSLPWAVRAEGQGDLRGANFQDVCILLPARTGLRSLERALDEANVPYRVEGQSLVLGTQDVRELLDCLRAIDAPADQIALVAALRSSAFGCSDLELLEFIEQGGRLDYVNPTDASGPVREALSVLLRYHLERTWTPPDELIEKFVREQAMVEVSFARARPRERWRRLRFVIERARAFTQVKGNSLRSFLDWIERQVEEGARLVETPAPETDEDAVRIMTIHAAKGLEFPIVVLAGLGSAANFRSNTLLLDQKREKVEVRIGAREAGFSTGGYEEAKDREKEAEQAEDVRLMYVAATRARDHLVVCLFRSERATSSHAASISRMAAAAPELWNQIALTGAAASKAPGAVPTDVGVIDTGEDRERWQEDRLALIERASKPASLAVTALAGTEKDEAEGGEVPYRRGRGGASLGRAVHAVLQSVDLATGEGLEGIARAQAMAEGIPDRWVEIVELTSRALSSAVVKRAVSSGRYYREVFVSTPLNGTLLEGFIDLVFEEDGALVIADYKTDSLEEEVALEQARERYAIQVGAYALAVQQATSMPVREVVLIFLRPAREVSFKDISVLTDEARKLAEAKTEGSITG